VDNVRVTLNFSDIYIRNWNVFINLLEHPSFLDMVKTWQMLDEGIPASETPYYSKTMVMRDTGNPSWADGVAVVLNRRYGQYLDFKKGGYHPEKTGEYPVVQIRKETYLLCDGLTRVSMLYSLGIEKADFVISENCQPHYIPTRVRPITDERLKELVEEAHKIQLDYNTQKMVELPMHLYLPIKHPLYKDKVCSRFDSPRRLELMLNEIGDSTGKRVLDVGCCTGWFCLELASMGANAVGVEPLITYVDIAAFLALYHQVPWMNKDFSRRLWFYQMGVEQYLDELEEKFDFIIFMGLFHHLFKLSEEKAYKILYRLSERAPKMFFEAGLKGEAQMSHLDHPQTEDTVIDDIIKHSTYTHGKKLSDGLMRDWKNRDVRPDLPLRPLYMFWK